MHEDTLRGSRESSPGRTRCSHASGSIAGAVRAVGGPACGRKLPPRPLRLTILRVSPLARLHVSVRRAVVVTILVDRHSQNIVALVASVGLVLAFSKLKDYGSSLVARLDDDPRKRLSQDLDGGRRLRRSESHRPAARFTSSRLTTPKLSFRIHGSGRPAFSTPAALLLCVADFYLHPDHNALIAVRRRLTEIAT